MFRSLLAKTWLILALTVLAVLLCYTLIVTQFIILPVARQSADDQAALMKLAAETWVELPPYARSYYQLELAGQHLLLLTKTPPTTRPLLKSNMFLDMLTAALARRLETDIRLRLDKDDNNLVWASFDLPTGTVYIGFARERRAFPIPIAAILILTFASLLVLITSLTIVSRITRPLVAASRAARRIGKGLNFEPLDETGPEEMAVLARSFNKMGKEVRELLEHRTTLLAGISHDLRTPIARMQMAIELLDDGSNDELVERLKRNLTEMDTLIGDTLALSRGMEQAPLEALPPGPWLTDLVNSFQNDRLRLIRLTALPEKLMLPPLALKRVLTNLIENALRYSAPGPVTLEVTMQGPQITLTVLDRGPGIPAEAKAKIFEPFYRLEASRNKHTGGSGLGLAIVAQLCEMYNWHLAVLDNPAGGTMMQLSLLAESPDTEALPAPQSGS
ncbi:HAMP domain-containing sensor histidine kinase [Pokkaliibacter sp. MBI-7]|nr:MULTISPECIES: HAMP domain-containing sensor histidine kinase [Pokkaliibacter]MDH2432279.1 HAMP domain-containing sensor histidine kinase [Pokkaliibacter sp. MBI-7]PPC75266.1 two-component sensor histidine kinase [Pokkaliibacter plantistimulans]